MKGAETGRVGTRRGTAGGGHQVDVEPTTGSSGQFDSKQGGMRRPPEEVRPSEATPAAGTRRGDIIQIPRH